MEKFFAKHESLVVYGGSAVASLGILAVFMLSHDTVDSSRTVTVEKKEYVAPHAEFELVGLGKTAAIDTQEVPEQYLVYFVQCGHNSMKMQVDEEGCFHGYEAVSPEQYKDIDVGDEIQVPALNNNGN